MIDAIKNIEHRSQPGRWRPHFRPWPVLVGVAAVLSLVVKVIIALRTHGTNDVLYWERFLATANSAGGIHLYHSLSYFNHPPFMIHLLRVLGFMSGLTGLPFPFWIRVPAILADLCSVFLVWKLLEAGGGKTFAPLAVFLMALSPASIMVSGFHGNTDPLMIFFVLLSIFLVNKSEHAWLAGTALGMGVNIKVVPIVFAPAIFLFLPVIRKQIEFFFAVIATTFICWLPYIVQDPAFILDRLFRYNSIYGHWGLSRLVSSFPDITALYHSNGRYFVFAAIMIASIWMSWSAKKPSLFMQCGFITFLLVSLTPGFGIQYLAWLVPWVVGLGVTATLIYYITSGIFIFLVYNFWAGGLPWDLANSDVVGDWRDYMIYYEIVCWSAVVAITLNYLRPEH